jgi:predicted tellurium resistance membrane protein TerC
MRLVIGKLLSIVERYPPLVDGAFIIIAWVGVKLLLEFLHTEGYIALEIPKWLSLGLIVVIFSAAYIYARIEARHTQRRAEQEGAALLREEEDQP